MIQDKAQFAVNGMSFTRAATPCWIIRVAPCGRVVKRSYPEGITSAVVAPLGKDAPLTFESRLAVNRFTTR